ncbi:hypothetical protein GCM10027341_06010 [Spirosoma knui]
MATPEVKPVKLNTTLLCPTLTEITWFTLPSEMVSELAIALVKDTVPLTLY